MSAQKIFRLLLLLMVALLLINFFLFYLVRQKSKKEVVEQSPEIAKSNIYNDIFEGVQEMHITGILMENPFVDESNLLSILLKVDETNERAREVNIRGAVIPDQNEVQILPLTLTEKTTGDFSEQKLQESKLLSIDSMVNELQSFKGREITLSILTGEGETMQNFINKAFLTDCTTKCEAIKNELENTLPETLNDIGSLQQNDNINKGELIITVIIMNIYVEK